VNEFTDNMTYQKGVHTIKWGYNSRWTDQYGYNNAGIYPNVSLSTANGNSVPTTFGPGAAGQAAIASADLSRYQSLYNDLLGRVSSVTQTYYSDLSKFQAAGSSLIRNYLLREYGLFVQDDWRVRPNLTVNVGLRWEYFKPPVERDDFQGYLNKAGSVNTASNIDNLTVVKGQQWYNSDFKDFAPRLGFAWDPTGKGKTSIRGDFGIFYDRMIGAAVSLADGNTPGFSSPLTNYPNQTGTDVRVSDGVNAMVPALPAAPVLQLPANRGNAAGVLFNPNLTTGYVTHMSLGIQREVFRNTVLDVSYVGTRGIKLFMDEDMNQQKIYTSGFLSAFQQLQTACVGKTSCSALTAANPIVAVFGTAQSAYNSFGGTNVAQGAVYSAATTMDVNNYTKYAAAGLSEYYLRNYPQFQQLIEGTNDGRTYYNSLQVSVRRNVGALKMVANYTWSKSMDNWNSEGNGFTNSTVMDNYNLALNRGRADSDIPQAFNAATTYTLPIGKGHRFGTNWNRWLDTAFGGWDVGNLTVWQSGRTMTLTAGVNSGPFGANWANYTGDRNTGGVLRQGSGVFYFTPGQITAFTATTSFNGVSIPALLPAAGQVGSAGRNTFRGPRYFDMDFSLVKAFKLTERQRVTFRIESYDAFNNVNFNNPAFTATTAAATFGKITTDIASRVYQMALRYDF
jgi:hypothetical protein